MIDYYSLEKIAEGYMAETQKAAAQDRMAAQAAAARRKSRQAAPSRHLWPAPQAQGRTVGRTLVARLRALAFAAARRLEPAAEQRDG